jgi:hypothetical protein
MSARTLPKSDRRVCIPSNNELEQYRELTDPGQCIMNERPASEGRSRIWRRLRCVVQELRSATRSSSAKRRILEFWSSARKEVLWFAMAAGKNGV